MSCNSLNRHIIVSTKLAYKNYIMDEKYEIVIIVKLLYNIYIKCHVGKVVKII